MRDGGGISPTRSPVPPGTSSTDDEQPCRQPCKQISQQISQREFLVLCQLDLPSKYPATMKRIRMWPIAGAARPDANRTDDQLSSPERANDAAVGSAVTKPANANGGRAGWYSFTMLPESWAVSAAYRDAYFVN